MKNNKNAKQAKRTRRHSRIRSRVSGTATTPRLAVFRSNKYIYAQLINDVDGVTLASASDLKDIGKMTKVESAAKVGKTLAETAKKQKITSVVFDRGGFIFTGRVKALAEAAREGGLTF